MKKYFFAWKEVNDALNSASNEILSTIDELNRAKSDIVLKSLFTYGVTTFENAITDTLRQFIVGFPDKIVEKKIEVTKNELIENLNFLVEQTIDKSINSLTYGSLETYLATYCKIVCIEKIPDNDLYDLIEIKETRNLLVHNNLKINTVYLSKCKEGHKRANEEQINQKLPIDVEYAINSLVLCHKVILEYLYKPLEKKYSVFTKRKMMQEVWNELFNSPILEFEEYWEWKDDKLMAFKLDYETLCARLEVGYSKTEKLLFLYICLHYWGSLSNVSDIRGVNLDIINPNSLYGNRKEKYLYLQDILFRYPYLFEQD